MHLSKARKEPDWDKFKEAMAKEVEDFTVHEHWKLVPLTIIDRPKAKSSLISSSQFGHSRERGHQQANSSSVRADSVPMEDNKLPTPSGSPSVQLCSGQL